MDLFTLKAANKNAESLVAGLASGIKSHEVDGANNSIKFNFNDGTSISMKINTPTTQVEAAVNAYLAENPETEFLNVKKTGAKGDGVTNDSACFVEGVAGYVVNDGTYCVDGATMARLNEKNCIGNGYLKLLNPSLWWNDGTEKWYVPFDYTIAVKDLDNVLQKQMVSKGEANYFAELNRQNATAMLKPLEGECYAHTIGAIYKMQGAVLPDKFTACIGNLQLYLVGSDMILKRVRIDRNLKTSCFGFFELPWVPEVSRSVASDKYKIYDDHTEFYLTAEDFEGQAEGKTESVLHFWGNNADIGNRDDIIGVIASFDFWIKEDEARDKLIVQIGVDQMDYSTKTVKQACSGNALKMETYPRTSWSTSMNRELLDLYVNPKQLDYLHSLPFDNTFGTHQVMKDTVEYEQKIVSMANGDMYLKLFDDAKNYRDLQVINPIKHMYLPYCNPNNGSTGTYCKIFSIPLVTDSTQRYVFKMDVVRHSSTKVFSNISALLTIIRGGSVTIDLLSSNTSDKGVITVVTTDTSIDVYIKGMSWGYVVVDVELLMYADISMIQTINYDTDLLRIGAGTRTIMIDKWVAIDTTDCTVVESESTSPLEQRIVELESKPVFDTFPTDEQLTSLSNDTVFETRGFHSNGDGAACAYLYTKTWKTNAIAKGEYYIVPISQIRGELYLPYYGIRIGEEYAESNSEIMSTLTSSCAFGALLRLPSGHFYFNDTINLASKQLSLCGAGLGTFASDTNINGSTWLHFPNLTEDGVGISAATGSISNIVVYGNPNSYSCSIDRNKTYTAPEEIVTETVEVKAYGIKGGGVSNINNVSVMNFYYGMSIKSSNAYINNINFRSCHYGLTIGNDIKVRGLYGWNVMTLLKMTGSLSSAVQVRADSVGTHLVELSGYPSGIYLSDLDADYCCGSIVHFGQVDTYGSIGGTVINGIRGRASTKHVYDTTTDIEPSVDEITDDNIEEYGIISVSPKTTVNGLVVTVNNIGGKNPLDTTSNYKTPNILICAGTQSAMRGIQILLATYIETLSKEWLDTRIKSLSGNANNTDISINNSKGTVFYRRSGSTVSCASSSEEVLE